MWPLLLALLTLTVFALPLLPSVLEWRRRRDIRPLPIDGEHTLDVAAVAATFRAMIERQDERSGQRGMAHPVSALRPVVYVTGAFMPTRAEAFMGVCGRTIVTSGSLALPDSYTFSRDIYGRRGISTGRRNCVQTLLSEGEILMRTGSELRRWAHARSVHVEPQCRLQGPLSALYAIRLEDGCEFASVSAAVIGFGPRHTAAPPVVDGMDGMDGMDTVDGKGPQAGNWTHAVLDSAGTDGRWLVTHDLTFPANTLYRGDLVVHGDLWIGTGARIIGSVKASGSIWLGTRVRIDGALIAAGAISVARECAIAGPVASEREIDVGARSVIGAAARRTTVVAPLLRVHAGTVVYGAASALEEGRVVPDGHLAIDLMHPA
ncbi:hypothetical protein [Cupriavidus necator]|uniref:hypothetical protein n=1 Tax=Cupriavidus necator TaxID=106590 RepID=UPI00339D7316